MIHNILPVTTENLLTIVSDFFIRKYRFITLSCTDLGDAFDILYHFAPKDYELVNLRLRLEKDQELPSISVVYFSAVIVENEIKDLFGVKMKDLVVDYQGKLMLSEGSPVAPQAKPIPAAPAAN